MRAATRCAASAPAVGSPGPRLSVAPHVQALQRHAGAALCARCSTRELRRRDALLQVDGRWRRDVRLQGRAVGRTVQAPACPAAHSRAVTHGQQDLQHNAHDAAAFQHATPAGQSMAHHQQRTAQDHCEVWGSAWCQHGSSCKLQGSSAPHPCPGAPQRPVTHLAAVEEGRLGAASGPAGSSVAPARNGSCACAWKGVAACPGCPRCSPEVWPHCWGATWLCAAGGACSGLLCVLAARCVSSCARCGG